MLSEAYLPLETYPPTSLTIQSFFPIATPFIPSPTQNSLSLHSRIPLLLLLIIRSATSLYTYKTQEKEGMTPLLSSSVAYNDTKTRNEKKKERIEKRNYTAHL